MTTSPSPIKETVPTPEAVTVQETVVPSVPVSSGVMPPDKPKSNKSLLMIVVLLLLVLCAVVVLIIVVLLTRNAGNFENGTGVSPTPTGTVVVTSEEASPTPTQTTEVTVTPELTSGPTVHNYKIYLFDTVKFDTPGASDYLTLKYRSTNRTDMATFCIEQIIAGPNAAEITEGLSSTFGEGKFVKFTTASDCGGPDFTLQITGGKATVQFCRKTQLNGDWAGGVVSEQFSKTIKQFSTVSQVRVLDSAGQCFNDLAGWTPEECYQ